MSKEEFDTQQRGLFIIPHDFKIFLVTFGTYPCKAAKINAPLK